MKRSILGFILFQTIMIHAQTQIIAHRGFWKTNPETTENSLQSLKNAQNLKIYGSEFDVRMTKDGVLVINHDEHHGSLEISESNYADLIQRKLSNGENLPTLQQYLIQGFKDKSTRLIVELKPAKTPELEKEMVAKTLKLINELKIEKQCEYISFSLTICREIKKQKPEYFVAYLNGDLSPKQLKAENFNGFDYHYKILQKNPTWIKEAHELGLITNSWTVNNEETYNELKKMGIDFITTNIPNLLKNK